MRPRKFFEFLLSIPKNILLNLRLFGFSGIKLPVIISFRTKTSGLKRGSILLDCKKSFGLIVFGFSDGSFGRRYGSPSFLSIQKGAQLILHGKASIAQSSSIMLFTNARMEIGRDFMANYDFMVSCKRYIRIGDSSLFGWNVCLLDNDGHDIYQNGKVVNPPKSILIGNHVWICSDSTCLKGAILANGCILGSRSILVGQVFEDESLLVGNPAHIIKSGITWSA